MTKNEIKKAIENAVKFYDVINENFYEERDLALKKEFGESYGYTENEDTYEKFYTIDGVTYENNEEIAKAVFGIKTSDDYNLLLKELTDDAITDVEEGEVTTSDPLSLLLGFLVGEENGGVVIEKKNGEIEITPDGFSCYSPSYNVEEFLKAYSKK